MSRKNLDQARSSSSVTVKLIEPVRVATVRKISSEEPELAAYYLCRAVRCGRGDVLALWPLGSDVEYLRLS